MKQRYAIVTVALLDAEDDELLPAKRKVFLEWADATQRTWSQKRVA